MKKKKFLTLVLSLIALALFYFLDQPVQFAPPLPPVPEQKVEIPIEIPEGFSRVVRVVDGDTFVVEMGVPASATSSGVARPKIRLIGLDTPEVVDPRKPVQCFGREASAKAKEILEGQALRLESDPTQGDRDKYGRLLRYAFLRDGTLFNKLMIEEGYGHEYTYNIPYKYQKEFKDAQESAREAKKGLWADGVCEQKARTTPS